MEIYNGTYTVYCHENIANGKKYIGITKIDCKRRWGKNGYGYQSSPHFYAAIKKYGWNNFNHIIIANNLTQDEAFNFERLLIHKLKTINQSLGYNTAIGGQGGNNYKRTEDQCKHISNAIKRIYDSGFEPWNKGMRMSQEFREAVSNGSKGKHLSETTKEKIRKYQKGKKKNPESVMKGAKNRSGSKSKLSKKIYQYSEDMIFIRIWDCARMASRTLSINYSTLLACAHYRLKQAGGFIWRYDQVIQD